MIVQVPHSTELLRMAPAISSMSADGYTAQAKLVKRGDDHLLQLVFNLLAV